MHGWKDMVSLSGWLGHGQVQFHIALTFVDKYILYFFWLTKAHMRAIRFIIRPRSRPWVQGVKTPPLGP